MEKNGTGVFRPMGKIRELLALLDESPDKQSPDKQSIYVVLDKILQSHVQQQKNNSSKRTASTKKSSHKVKNNISFKALAEAFTTTLANQIESELQHDKKKQTQAYKLLRELQHPAENRIRLANSLRERWNEHANPLVVCSRSNEELLKNIIRLIEQELKKILKGKTEHIRRISRIETQITSLLSKLGDGIVSLLRQNIQKRLCSEGQYISGNWFKNQLYSILKRDFTLPPHTKTSSKTQKKGKKTGTSSQLSFLTKKRKLLQRPNLTKKRKKTKEAIQVNSPATPHSPLTMYSSFSTGTTQTHENKGNQNEKYVNVYPINYNDEVPKPLDDYEIDMMREIGELLAPEESQPGPK